MLYWFTFTMSLIPSNYFQTILLPNCTLLDRRLTQVIHDYDAMRSEISIDSETGYRLQEFRETIIDITDLSKC